MRADLSFFEKFPGRRPDFAVVQGFLSIGQVSSYPPEVSMFARRMLTFVAVLLALTALAAAFAPPPPRESIDITAPSTQAPPSDPGETVSEKLSAGAKKPRTITVEQGDILHLEVTGTKLDNVEVKGLSGLKPLGPEAVAIFDVLASEPGEYPVVLNNSGDTIATIEVLPPEREGLAPTDPLTDRSRET